jgi:sugar lactone lactonase YvrE
MSKTDSADSRGGDPIDTLADTGLVLCDGPRWHDDALWFSDLYGGRVYRVTLDGTMTPVVDVAAGPSGLAFTPDGSLLIVSQRDQRILRRSPSGDERLYADLAGVCRSPRQRHRPRLRRHVVRHLLRL